MSKFNSSSKYLPEQSFRNGFGSVFTTWPNLLPAYTLSYTAATGKPLDNGKKKLFVLLVLLLLLITSLIASLVLALLWFNAIQADFTGDSSVKLNSDLPQHSRHHHHKLSNHHQTSTPPTVITRSSTISTTTTRLSSTTTTTTHTTSTTTSTSSTKMPSSRIPNDEFSPVTEDDGFGESEQNPPIDQPANNEEHLNNYFKNMKNELDRNRSNKIRNHDEKLDGEFVEHHTIDTNAEDDQGELSFLQPEQPATQSSNSNESEFNLSPSDDYSPIEPNLNLPEQLAGMKARQFCNLNGIVSDEHRNSSFVIVAKINSLKEKIFNLQADPNERQLISKYDVHIERILKRSPLLSVAFKKQVLTTNVTINLALLADELSQSNSGSITCLGQNIELRPGQTYLLSGHTHGLSAVSGNCDLQLEWFNDLDEDQRNRLINWSSSRMTFSHC